jgi:hypothetical protein
MKCSLCICRQLLQMKRLRLGGGKHGVHTFLATRRHAGSNQVPGVNDTCPTTRPNPSQPYNSTAKCGLYPHLDPRRKELLYLRGRLSDAEDEPALAGDADLAPRFRFTCRFFTRGSTVEDARRSSATGKEMSNGSRGSRGQHRREQRKSPPLPRLAPGFASPVVERVLSDRIGLRLEYAEEREGPDMRGPWGGVFVLLRAIRRPLDR